MSTNANRIYRSQSVTLGIRQHVVPRPFARPSKQLFKYIGLTILFAVMLTISAGQILHWQTTKNSMRLDGLQAVKTNLRNEHINLLANKARLTSRSAIEKIAAADLYLFAPDKSQIHNL